MSAFVIGLDAGSTNTKAAIFDGDGNVQARTAIQGPRPASTDRREVDATGYADRVLELLHSLSRGVDTSQITGLGVVAHGDGVTFVSADGDPVGPMVLSSDARAAGILQQWAQDGTAARLHDLTGVQPFAGSPAALLRWFEDRDPELLANAARMLSTKDWLRASLTGSLATDRTDASASFVDPVAQDYSPGALDAAGVSRSLLRLLPPIEESTAPAGLIQSGRIAGSGLPSDVVVSVGAHDVSASVLGGGGPRAEVATIIAGTFGVTASWITSPLVAPRLNTRLGPVRDSWVIRRTSRASASNVDWVRSILPGVATPAADDLQLDRGAPHFIPYLRGGNDGTPDGAAFVGLRDSHDSVTMLKAALEGVAFMHRLDLDELRSAVPIRSVFLVGGLSRASGWPQLLADAIGLPVEISDDVEAGTRGAAMIAAVTTGIVSDLHDAWGRMRSPSRVIEPDPRGVRARETRFRRFVHLTRALTDVAPGDLDEE